MNYNNKSFAYVDLNVLIEKYDRTAVVREELKGKTEKLNSNVDSLMSDWKKEIQSYEKERSSMSKKEIELKQELLGNKQQQINNYQQAIQKQIQEEDQKATQTVVNDINDYVKEYGKKKDYSVILGATGNGNVMFADDAINLTDKVLEGLNKEFNGE